MKRKVESWTADIEGVPAVWLRQRWLDDLQQPEFFDSVAASDWIGHFCRDHGVGVFLYSFERKTFEQAMLAAVQAQSSKTLTCGYQNAAVTNKHFHFSSYSGVPDVHPDRILTVGAVTTQWMRDTAGYPAERLVVAGALRQRRLLERTALRRPLQNLLVLWAEGREQYSKFWQFMCDAWEQDWPPGCFARIRLHPAIPFEFPNSERHAGSFEVDPLVDIRQSIDWADAILYASTSLAIVAMSSGIPVISVRLRDFFDDDCIPATGEMLHWRVERPADLKTAVDEIDALYDEDYEEKLMRSKQFGREYFQEATPERFLGAVVSTEPAK